MELHAHHFGGVNRPAACSITSPSGTQAEQRLLRALPAER
jgi:hypothetical protein